MGLVKARKVWDRTWYVAEVIVEHYTIQSYIEFTLFHRATGSLYGVESPLRNPFL